MELAAIRKEQRRIDGEVQGLTAKIQPEEKRLYDGSVRNPKELSSIQHEVELLKANRSRLEDQLLEVMSRLEMAEADHKTAQSELSRAEATRAGETESLDRDRVRLNGALASGEARRMGQQGKIPVRSLAIYEEVRRRHAGGAVARIVGGACGGCRVSIPEAVRRRAFSGMEL